MNDNFPWFMDEQDVDGESCRELRSRARAAGYRLVHRPCWILVAAEDEQPVYSAPALVYIEQFLDE